MRRVLHVGRLLGAAVALTALGAGSSYAVDRGIPATINLYKGGLFKLVSKGAFTLAENPAVLGATLVAYGSAGTFSTALPASGWSGDTTKGFKFKGSPCAVIILKANVIKAVCKDNGDLALPDNGEVLTTINIGSDTYCALCGGTPSGAPDKIFKRKSCAAPTVCAKTADVSCCGGTRFSFTTTIGAGSCGSVTNANGSLHTNLNCGGLYFGGGLNSVPGGSPLPDMGSALSRIISCNGTTASIGATTSADTGSNRTCSAQGCLFGAPLSIPNTTTPPLSTCVVNVVARSQFGTVDCSTGDADIDLPLTSQVHLTGDIVPGTPGINPCPLCLGGTCDGGPNDGQACVPGTSTYGSENQYPTSHDCPPPPANLVGNLPINFDLHANETVTAQASGSQANVFCGFCRDADDTGCFEGDPGGACPASSSIRPCSANADCTNATFESCEQRNSGAFGPGGSNAKTITATGFAGGDLTDLNPHPATLVSVFCIPPTFNAAIDGSADLPGPGASILVGNMEIQ